MKAIRNHHGLLGLLLALLVSCASPTPKPDPAPVEVPDPIISETSEEEESIQVDDVVEIPEILDAPEKDEPSAVKVVPIEEESNSPPSSVSIIVHQVQEKDAGDSISHAAEEENDELAEPAKEEVSAAQLAEYDVAVRDLCDRIGNKLGSVSPEDCHSKALVHSGYSTGGTSLAYLDYEAVEGREPLGKVLVLGGIHGDEFSSVSVLFKWLKILDQHHSGLFEWRFLPLTNPDGLLQRKSQRQNINGVDLNRNFPTADWDRNALEYWEEATYRNPRRYPGPSAASEVETKWILEQIDQFKPDVVIAMHAPYHLVDYDGPPTAPKNLGGLYLRKLGVFPGSLGNYVGIDLGKPIVTVELKSAGIMPSRAEIETMWGDLVSWLRNQLKN